MSDLVSISLPRHLRGPEGLALAVLYRAARDLAEGQRIYADDARVFLASPACEALLASLIDQVTVHDRGPGVSAIDEARAMLRGLLARYDAGN